MAGIIIAAPGSGSGKTIITCALLEALKEGGKTVSVFKCGPDYIDPMFHQRVIGVESRNLDTFFSGEQQIRKLYDMDRVEGEFSVVEGVMGLYDGLGGIRKEGSAYHLAQTLDLPIVLVVDAHGMGRTIISVIAGILQYDTDCRIAGIILNRTSCAFYEAIKAEIEKELTIPVLGFFPKTKGLEFESRHLGLKLPHEIKELQSQVRKAAEILNTHVEVESLLKIAERLDFTHKSKKKFISNHTYTNKLNEKLLYDYELNTVETLEKKRVRIGIAQDEAFCFYYKDNLRMLELAGAELVPFSPIHDTALPENIQGILLGGGYPELVARELSENVSMRNSILEAIEGGMPSVAECGGFMYLHEFLQDEQGQKWPMVGAVHGGCAYKGKLVRFGYVEIQEKVPLFIKKDSVIKAHEFHYYDSEQNGEDCEATKPVSGRSWSCVHVDDKSWWGFPHLYYPSNPDFVRHFVDICNR